MLRVERVSRLERMRFCFSCTRCYYSCGTLLQHTWKSIHRPPSSRGEERKVLVVVVEGGLSYYRLAVSMLSHKVFVENTKNWPGDSPPSHLPLLTCVHCSFMGFLFLTFHFSRLQPCLRDLKIPLTSKTCRGMGGGV